MSTLPEGISPQPVGMTVGFDDTDFETWVSQFDAGAPPAGTRPQGTRPLHPRKARPRQRVKRRRVKLRRWMR